MEELRVRCEPVQILIPSRSVGFQNGREVLDLDCASAPEEVADGPFKVIHWDRVPAIIPNHRSADREQFFFDRINLAPSVCHQTVSVVAAIERHGVEKRFAFR